MIKKKTKKKKKQQKKKVFPKALESTVVLFDWNQRNVWKIIQFKLPICWKFSSWNFILIIKV